jgi:hypothetical protein
MRDETRKALELFREKAARLASLNYVKWLQQHRGTPLQIGEEQGTIRQTRPSDNYTDALLLTLRLFIQQRDRCSFEWLHRHVLDDSGLSDQWKSRFEKLYSEFNGWLDSLSGLAIQEGEVESHPLTKREIMDVFVYGDAAHVDPKKKQMFDQWISESHLLREGPI